jgi:membrane protease YdiL (CAAX protease family)
LMGSLVAGICEERGFRGYIQVALEKLYGRRSAILLTSMVFTLLHLGKAWSWYLIPMIFLTSVLLGILASRTGSLIPCIIAHTLFDIINFSYWWSHLAGSFRMTTIFVSGIDLPFVGALFVVTGACLLFFRATKKADP